MNVQKFSLILLEEIDMIKDKCKTLRTEPLHPHVVPEGHESLNTDNVMALVISHYKEICAIIDKFFKKPGPTINSKLIDQIKTNKKEDKKTPCDWPFGADAIDKLYWDLHRQNLVPSGADYDRDLVQRLFKKIKVDVNPEIWVPAIYYAAMDARLRPVIMTDTIQLELNKSNLQSLVQKRKSEYTNQIEYLSGCGRLDPSLGIERLLEMRLAAIMVLSKL